MLKTFSGSSYRTPLLQKTPVSVWNHLLYMSGSSSCALWTSHLTSWATFPRRARSKSYTRQALDRQRCTGFWKVCFLKLKCSETSQNLACHFWMSSFSSMKLHKATGIVRESMVGNMGSCVVISVPADGLAPLGARPSADAVMTEFGNCRVYDNVIRWKHFPRYWSPLRGIHLTKARDAELWCFQQFSAELSW